MQGKLNFHIADPGVHFKLKVDSGVVWKILNKCMVNIVTSVTSLFVSCFTLLTFCSGFFKGFLFKNILNKPGSIWANNHPQSLHSRLFVSMCTKRILIEFLAQLRSPSTFSPNGPCITRWCWVVYNWRDGAEDLNSWKLWKTRISMNRNWRTEDEWSYVE